MFAAWLRGWQSVCCWLVYHFGPNMSPIGWIAIRFGTDNGSQKDPTDFDDRLTFPLKKSISNPILKAAENIFLY